MKHVKPWHVWKHDSVYTFWREIISKFKYNEEEANLFVCFIKHRITKAD